MHPAKVVCALLVMGLFPGGPAGAGKKASPKEVEVNEAAQRIDTRGFTIQVPASWVLERSRGVGARGSWVLSGPGRESKLYIGIHAHSKQKLSAILTDYLKRLTRSRFSSLVTTTYEENKTDPNAELAIATGLGLTRRKAKLRSYRFAAFVLRKNDQKKVATVVLAGNGAAWKRQRARAHAMFSTFKIK